MRAAFASREFPGAWFPKELYCDLRVSANVRFLVAEVRALSQNGRPCWASDAHFSEFLGVSERHVRRLLSQAEEAGWIRREMIETGANGGHTRIIHCLFGFFGPTSTPPRGGVDISVHPGWTDSATIESHGLDKSKAKAEAVQPNLDSAPNLPRAHAHEETAVPLTPLEERLAALKSPTAATPLLIPASPPASAPASDSAGLLGAFDTSPWEGEQGSKGGECSSQTLDLPFTAIEDVFEEFYCAEPEDDDLPVDPRTPPAQPPLEPPRAPRDDGEGARLLMERGVLPDVAAALAEEHDLSRIRDICELAPLRGWNSGAIVRCFSAGYDKEAGNRRKLAAARGQPAADPQRGARPSGHRSTYAEHQPVDDEYRRFLRNELTPEEAAKHEAQREFIRAEKAKLFPERARPDGTRKQILPPPVEPAVRGSSDPRPIAEIMAERQRGARP